MLGLLKGFSRSAPPATVPEPIGRQVTTPEYQAAVRLRAIAAMQERRRILDEVGARDRARERIQAMKKAIDAAETIRSSRFLKDKGEK